MEGRALTPREGGVIGTTPPPRQTLPEALAVGVNPRTRPGGISGLVGFSQYSLPARTHRRLETVVIASLLVF